MLVRYMPARAKARLIQMHLALRLVPSLVVDARRFIRHSGGHPRSHRSTRLRALITIDYHKLEKGLALPAPRPEFGGWVVKRMITNLDRHIEATGACDDVARVALNALDAWCQFNRREGVPQARIEAEVTRLRSTSYSTPGDQGGVREVTREDVLSAGAIDLREFFARRHSVREFAPSVWTRRPSNKRWYWHRRRLPSAIGKPDRVHLYSDPRLQADILACQNGNRGFGEQISQLLIVSAELGNFVSVGERNQCWIDGGMFAASLVYALHSLGLGTCCLNCSNDYEADALVRRAAHIPDSEVVIMMIAVGHLPLRFRVAHSPRQHLDRVLVAHQPTGS